MLNFGLKKKKAQTKQQPPNKPHFPKQTNPNNKKNRKREDAGSLKKSIGDVRALEEGNSVKLSYL